MASKFMSREELTASRHALQDANDIAVLLSLAQRLARHYPDDPDARRLLVEIAAKRERLASPTRPRPPAGHESSAPL